MNRLIVAVACCFVLTACASDEATDDATGAVVPAVPNADTDETGAEKNAEAPEKYDVETRTETFVDTTRTTEANGSVVADDRTLVTDLYVPVGDGPFPLVVIAHGFDGHARKFTELATSWAEAGYVVAVPTFPVTNDEFAAPDILGYMEQPADVSFVIDEVLATESQADPERIGVGGLSLGGATTYGLMFNPCCIDDRIDAAIVMDGFRMPFDDDADVFTPARPLLVVHGTTDEAIPYEGSDAEYRQAGTPKFYVTYEGGSHSSPFENTESPHDDITAAVTRDFWDAYLGDDPDAAAALVADATVDGLAHVEFEE